LPFITTFHIGKIFFSYSLIFFLVTGVTQASARMRAVALRKNCKLLIYNYGCVTSVIQMKILHGSEAKKKGEGRT